MTVVGRLSNTGNLLLQGEINERIPVVKNGLVAHYPFDTVDTRYVPSKIRYIRDHMEGSTSNTSNHWVEIQAFDDTKTNVALGKTGTSSSGTWSSYLTDGNTATSPYWGFGSGPTWVQVDLGDLYFIEEIKVWHYYGDGRTYYKTKTEVSQDGVNWFVIFDSAIEGTYQETSSGKTHDMQNLGATVRPSTNVNTTFGVNGISIEEGTTNISPRDGSFNSSSGKHIGNPDLSNGNYTYFNGGWRAATHYNDGICEIIQSTTPYGWGNIARWTHGVVTGWKGITSDVSFSANSAKTYTISVYVRVNGNANPSAYAFYGDTNTRLHFSWEKTPREYQNEWIRGTCIFSPDVTHSGGVYLYGDSDGAEGSTIDYSCYQIEEKSFATSFTNGTRGDSQLSLSKIVPKTGDYTIHFKCKVNTTIGNAQSYNSIMSMGNYYSNNSWTIMDTGGSTVGGNLGFIRKGNAGEWGWATTSLVPSSDHGKVINITITKDSTKYYCYYNGVLRGSIDHLSTEMQDLLWIGSRQNGGNMDTTTFYGLSIYNRVLTDGEINKLVNNQMSITKEGNIIGAKIVEEDLQLINDASVKMRNKDGKVLLKGSIVEGVQTLN